jgi:hypothetical protein
MTPLRVSGLEDFIAVKVCAAGAARPRGRTGGDHCRSQSLDLTSLRRPAKRSGSAAGKTLEKLAESSVPSEGGH